MAKYYTTCGSLELVTTAGDARSAALWSIHQFLARHIELESVSWLDEEIIDRQDIMEAMLCLADTVFVSEIGFGRDDAGIIDTADLLTEWNQLVVAVTRLQERITDDDRTGTGSRGQIVP
jgi:hypothetical protein